MISPKSDAHHQQLKSLMKLYSQFAHYLPLVEQVMQQTMRRVLNGESVPATEKVVSLFEAHTDVIVKDRRETYYGHKIFLTGGPSGLILDCAIEKANPADSTWALPMLKRQRSIYGRAPRQASFDGGFASRGNLIQAKALGVSDVCFAKRRGIAVLDMVKSSWVYRKLRAFRAGIESVISFLKRAFGLDRCVWRARPASSPTCDSQYSRPTCSRSRDTDWPEPRTQRSTHDGDPFFSRRGPDFAISAESTPARPTKTESRNIRAKPHHERP